jgi:heme exporter protein B
MLCIFELIIVPIVLVAFGLSIADNLPELVLVLVLGNIGISSIGTLFSAIVQLARTRGSLLSILVLAVLLPMMIPATSALMFIFGAVDPHLQSLGAMGFVGSFKNAIGYMAVFDAVFVTASWLLFPFAVRN